MNSPHDIRIAGRVTGGEPGHPDQAAGKAPMTTRLALLFTLLVVLLLAVATAYMSYSWRDVKAERLKELSNLVALGAASSQLFLLHYTERAAMLTADLAEQGFDDKAAVQALLHRYHGPDRNIAAIYVFDEAGQILATSNNTPDTDKPPHRSDPVFSADFETVLRSPSPLPGRGGGGGAGARPRRSPAACAMAHASTTGSFRFAAAAPPPAAAAPS